MVTREQEVMGGWGRTSERARGDEEGTHERGRPEAG